MRKRALFLDRDGVINIDKGYVHRAEDFEFVEGIFDLCASFQEKGFLLIVVTNQSGIARKLYTEQDFEQLTAWMIDRFKDHGVHITKVYHCADHPDFTVASDRRKPAPGMILEAAEEFDIDLPASILIGDQPSDIEAAERAGITRRFLVTKDKKINRSDVDWFMS